MDQAAKIYLKSYLTTLSSIESLHHKTFDSYYFCSDEINANNCAELVLKGEKRATASLAWWYENENEPFPEIGQLIVVTDWDKVPKCIIETTSVETRPFKEVDEPFAFEEGEGDKSLAHWRREHWKFFTEECRELKKEPHESMPVVLEQFKVVYDAAFDTESQ